MWPCDGLANFPGCTPPSPHDCFLELWIVYWLKDKIWIFFFMARQSNSDKRFRRFSPASLKNKVLNLNFTAYRHTNTNRSSERQPTCRRLKLEENAKWSCEEKPCGVLKRDASSFTFSRGDSLFINVDHIFRAEVAREHSVLESIWADKWLIMQQSAPGVKTGAVLAKGVEEGLGQISASSLHNLPVGVSNGEEMANVRCQYDVLKEVL